MADLSTMSDDELLAAYQREKARVAPAGAPKARQLSAADAKAIAAARAAAESAQTSSNDAQQFLTLNRQAGTGQGWGIPFASEARAAFDPVFAGMQSITNRMAPLQRQPGSGGNSDTDVKMFKRAVPNPDYTGPTNTLIARRLESDAKRTAGYSAFMERWAQERGNLLGAQAAWTAYQASGARAPGAARRVPAPATPPPRRPSTARVVGFTPAGG
jgi:hypothetical protein